jgi:hypothetical protein
MGGTSRMTLFKIHQTTEEPRSSVTTSSYCPLPALRPSWPGGGSCRPG